MRYTLSVIDVDEVDLDYFEEEIKRIAKAVHSKIKFRRKRQ